MNEINEIVEAQIDGVGHLRFEHQGPGVWTTQAGAPGKKTRRRYLLDSVQVPGVTDIVATLDKPGVNYWRADHAARGAVAAERGGHLVDVPSEEIVKRLRALGLGPDAIADEAAARGTALHVGMHELATTGEPPNPKDYPAEWRPWLRGASNAWLRLDPEVIASEFMVANTVGQYAGRPDLLCRSEGLRTLVDYKSGKGVVYDTAHYQTRAYGECLEECGYGRAERIVIIGIDDRGGAELIDCEVTALDWNALLHVYRSRKRVNSGMSAQRAIVRETLKIIGGAG